MSLPSSVANILGDTSLDAPFDVAIIGSGAGGGTAAYVLASAGLKVVVLEAGNNYFPGLDDPAGLPFPLFSNDEIKSGIRRVMMQDPVIEPRTFRETAAELARAHPDVNLLARTVGGTTVHADMKYPRFNEIDFRMKSALDAAGRVYPSTSFADWPFSYEDLEPFYGEAERLSGVSGVATGAGADPFASIRSTPFPLPPSHEMYVARVLANGATQQGYRPNVFPSAINSRPYDGRPACVNCGFCSGFGCPNNSKNSAAVTTLRKALLTGNCQVRFNAHVSQLISRNDGTHVVAAEYIDDEGTVRTVAADRFVLAASPIESVRLCWLSGGLGNAADQLGRHMMFHFQTTGVGIFKQRLHGERGQSVSSGMSDFRGVAEGGTSFRSDFLLGGVIEFGTSSEPIRSTKEFLRPDALAFAKLVGLGLKQLLIEGPFTSHIGILLMQGEDAPQAASRVDLDPTVRDVFGLPAPRLTYQNHRFELAASAFYKPKMLDILEAAGAQFGFFQPFDPVPESRHVMGGLRMGTDPATSVCDANGKFHEVDNLHATDGAVFVTGSGYNPTLTIIATALRTAGAMIDPDNPAGILSQPR